MDGWHFALYAFAVYLAVRTLVSLMKAHELELRRELAEEAATQGSPPREVSAERRAG